MVTKKVAACSLCKLVQAQKATNCLFPTFKTSVAAHFCFLLLNLFKKQTSAMLTTRLSSSTVCVSAAVSQLFVFTCAVFILHVGNKKTQQDVPVDRSFYPSTSLPIITVSPPLTPLPPLLLVNVKDAGV